MRTRSNFYPSNSAANIPRRSNRRRIPNIVEPELRTITKIIPMAERTMEELLQALTEGDIPNDAIKVMIFSYSLEDRARIWYEIEPPNSILTWDDLVNKFVNQFFPPSKTTHLENEISRFTQRFEETFSEAWDCFKELLGLVHTTDSQKRLYKSLKINQRFVTREAKAVEKTCVTYGGAHAYYECIDTDSNPSSVCAATGSYNQVSPPNRASHQILPPGFAPVQNNSNRFNQGFQNQPFLVPNNHIPPSVPNDFSIAIKSMQNQINVLRGDFSKQEENLRRNLNDDMRNILSSFFLNQPSTSGTLPSNTIPNPKGEMKAMINRSGLAYYGPSIPTESPLEKVDEQNTKEILDQEHSNSSGSTTQVQPLVVPISILEPDVSRTQSKSLISYPSRLNDQKLREKATNQMEKFFQIFQDLHFDISFADALLLMPKFASTIKSLLANKDKLFVLAKVPLNENCSAMLLKKLPEKLGDLGKFLIPCDFPRMEVCHALADLGASINLMPLSIWKKLSLPELTPTRMTLELADRSITHPKGVAKDVFFKVGKFHFPTDFVVVDFEADPRVPLILGRSFLRTGHALIDVYGEEITLRVNDESITFNLSQTMRYSSTCDDTSVNRVNVIDVACEDFVQDILDFQYNSNSSSPTLVSDDLISESKDDYKPTMQSQRRVNPKIHDVIKNEVIKLLDARMIYHISDSLEGIVLGHKISMSGIEIDRAKVDVIAKLPHPTTFKGVSSFLGHASFYRRFIQDFSKIARPMTHLLKKETHFVFSKEYIDAFNTLKKKLTEAPILVVPDWNLPFELMCDASDYAIGAVLGHCKSKNFQPIHYASKTMTEAQIHYTTTEKEMLDAKPRLLRWVLLLQEFDITILDKKGSENLAADHLSRLENLHQDVLKNKDINENFPLETLGSLTSHNTPWELLKFSKLAMRDLPGDIMVPISQRRRGKEKYLREMRCLKTVSKFVRYSIFGENYVIYKERTKKLHDFKIKNCIFNVDDQVLLFNSRLKIFSGKLKTRWSGPFTITCVIPYGTIELSQPNGPNFKVNGHRVKHYLSGDIPSNVAPDLHTFLMDN
nr:reverse transcriptase domain-containing protein [Tanacetum cinerariifolium]